MEIYNYLLKTENIVSLVEFIFFAVLSVVLLVKTGNTRQLKDFVDSYKKFFSGGTEMQYRKEDYREKNPEKGQTFEKKLKLYRYDKAQDVLVEDGEVDIQEMINSSLSSCMSEALAKFFPERIPTDDRAVELENYRDDLDFLQETFSVAEQYRDKLGLDENASVSDIYKAMAKKEEELRAIFAKKTEVKKDEKETLKESE